MRRQQATIDVCLTVNVVQQPKAADEIFNNKPYDEEEEGEGDQGQRHKRRRISPGVFAKNKYHTLTF